MKTSVKVERTLSSEKSNKPQAIGKLGDPYWGWNWRRAPRRFSLQGKRKTQNSNKQHNKDEEWWMNNWPSENRPNGKLSFRSTEVHRGVEPSVRFPDLNIFQIWICPAHYVKWYFENTEIKFFVRWKQQDARKTRKSRDGAWNFMAFFLEWLDRPAFFLLYGTRAVKRLTGGWESSFNFKCESWSDRKPVSQPALSHRLGLIGDPLSSASRALTANWWLLWTRTWKPSDKGVWIRGRPLRTAGLK